MSEIIDEAICKRIGTLAIKALMYEVAATPKPGLVDRVNNGAHSDMDYFTFIDSGAELSHYFHDCAAVALRYEGDKTMTKLRTVGIEAEAAMLRATGGVNTHKGMIYSLGLLSAAAARVMSSGMVYASPIDEVCAEAASFVRNEAAEELASVIKPKTYGEMQYKEYGFLGARGEAASGYSSARSYGLPVLDEALSVHGLSLNDSMVSSLISLIANVTDSNVIGRCGIDVLRESQLIARSIMDAGAMATPDGRAMIMSYDDWCIKNNVSHGGACDLLAVTMFLKFVRDEIKMF